ncbi:MULTISPECIES: TetR/AcrR family transcriptional regulator [unclassified Gordonia (in: high G+C Gram-positive bacteria)]
MHGSDTVGGSAPAESRRAQNMRDKHDRIFRAAAELFAERGYDGVSTGAVSERAEVAAGTVFRYASSKSELLLMVLNEGLRTSLDEGAVRAQLEVDTAEAVMLMVQPMLAFAAAQPENGQIYQRELLYGSSTDRYRAEGLALVSQLQQRIADRLVDDAVRRHLPAEHDRAMLTANLVFAATALAIARRSTGAHPRRDPYADVRAQVHIAVAGYFSASSTDR